VNPVTNLPTDNKPLHFRWVVFYFPNLLSLEILIWRDLDQDGIQDEGEDGVADVNITLYNSANEEHWNRYNRLRWEI